MNDIPDSVLQAFPLIQDKTSVRQLASPVPLVPDTTFDIFVTDSQDYIALITTDYADPLGQSRELKSISGSYEFEFTNLIMPYDNDRTVEVLEHDEMDGNFLVSVPYKNYRLQYYVANLKFDDEN